MTTLKFADTHNMVTFLAKPAESEGFEQIVDFLNAHTIKYALTVNPTIYTSCIEQFWATVKAKTVNGEVQLQALVDGKKIIITESIVRRDLQLEYAEGVDCLPNATIFEQLTLMGYEKLSQKLTFYKAFFSQQWKFLIHTILQCLSAKPTTWNEFSSTMASAIICLATNQKFIFSKYIFESMVKNLENVSGKFLMYPRFVQVFVNQQLEGMPTHKRIYIAPSHTKKIFGNIRRVGKGFSRRDTPLFQTMVVQDQEKIDEAINEEMDDSLVRAAHYGFCLEAQSRTDESRSREEKEVKNSRVKRLYKVGSSRRVESSDEEGLGEEDASKQGKIYDIDDDVEITLVSTHFDADIDMFGVHDLDGDEVVVESKARAGEKRNVEEVVSIIDTASIIPVSAAITRTITTFITDDEITLAKALVELKSAKSPTQAASTRPKAKIKADYQLAQRLQVQEQEELTNEEKTRLFVQFLEQRRKHFAAKRAEEKRNRSPTRAQSRSIMCNYLKNMEGWKPKNLKNKSFANIQELFDKAMNKVNTFVDYRTELVEENDGDDVTIDATPLSTKSPTNVDYKIYKEGKKIYFQIISADVKARFKKTEPVNYMDNFLLLNLKTMFEYHVKDNVWKNQQGLVKVLNWKLYDSCRVHYLQVDYEFEMAFELLRLVKKQLKEGYVPK
ncbi:hypothetical protein Tco_0494910 [Tanacetum coccineum]